MYDSTTKGHGVLTRDLKLSRMEEAGSKMRIRQSISYFDSK